VLNNLFAGTGILNDPAESTLSGLLIILPPETISNPLDPKLPIVILAASIFCEDMFVKYDVPVAYNEADENVMDDCGLTVI
jgi:hypothetical protein